ncbi:translation elongation factor 4 [uncultured Helcococcus sp.]|uniref:translation elongation factor 4 n=1 Tax=uncultured Helcococcus sp. TaxID=1072508 RepID=UPI00261C212F|nr:translation elongation factor 4 [uncultured Helcococcus sp.]
MDIKKENIRNFSIIAHIDHGKSTLADRLIEETGSVTQREMSDRLLDSMDLEKERGITIKLKAVKIFYDALDGERYMLNLIDTPGHVDFNYEVSRSLAACEGALLIVDASQGIEAQTLANTYLAMNQNLEIVPVINKIDLPSARVDEIRMEIEDVLALEASEAPAISAKEGINIRDVLEAIVKEIPAPKGRDDNPLQALIFDSYYDTYRGVVMYVRVKEGKIYPGQEIKMMSTGSKFEVTEVGYSMRGEFKTDEITAGDVGYVVASIKDIKQARVGDTITSADNPAAEPLPGYQKALPMVYSGLYPAEGESYNDIRDALEKLKVNDAALEFEPETSAALGYGFRTGFLGLLHMEIIQERLDREFGLDIIATAPSVIYRIHLKDGKVIEVQNPTDYPDQTLIDFVEEPLVKASIMTPEAYIGQVMELCQEKRGVFETMEYLDKNLVQIKYILPLNEVIYDFFDALKSKTRGYASLDYDFYKYQRSDLVRLDILLNGEPVDALSLIVHEDKAYERGRKISSKLKEEIPKHMFSIPIQAAIGAKIIARETVSANRKDVIAKCYGGDISRKRKLLEKQKEGKKRMRSVGRVQVPQDAFLAVLKYDEGE